MTDYGDSGLPLNDINITQLRSLRSQRPTYGRPIRGARSRSKAVASEKIALIRVNESRMSEVLSQEWEIVYTELQEWTNPALKGNLP
jgi:hypothetical protein